MDKLFNTAIKAAIKAGERILEVYNDEDFQISKKDDNSPLTKADRDAHEIIALILKETGIAILSEEGRSIPYAERGSWERFWMVDPLDGTKEFIKRNGEFTVNIALIERGAPAFGVVFAPVLKELYIGVSGEGAWLLDVSFESVDIKAIKDKGVSLPISAGPVPDRSLVYKVVASRSHMSEDTRAYIDRLKSEKGKVELLSKGSSLKLCMVASGQADEYPRLGPTMEWDVAAAHAVVIGAGKKVYIYGSKKELVYNKKDLLNPYFLVI